MRRAVTEGIVAQLAIETTAPLPPPDRLQRARSFATTKDIAHYTHRLTACVAHLGLYPQIQ
jgi:hypothetical protein